MSDPSSAPYILGAHLPLRMDAPPADFQTAWQLAREKAREISPTAMMLSWCNGRTGEFHPNVNCGQDERPSWIHSAEAKGADLTIDVNDGEFVFIFLTGA